jgi:hypothetical protein
MDSAVSWARERVLMMRQILSPLRDVRYWICVWREYWLGGASGLSSVREGGLEGSIVMRDFGAWRIGLRLWLISCEVSDGIFISGLLLL